MTEYDSLGRPKTPRGPRKRVEKPRWRRKGTEKVPQRRSKRQFFSEVWNDPVKRAEFLKKRKNAPGKPKGLPDGWRWADWKEHVKQIKEEARKMAEDLRKLGEITDDDRAEIAMAACIEILKMDGENRTRLQAAKTILEYTKSKPAQKSDVTVHSAEDFLKQILNEQPKPDADRSA